MSSNENNDNTTNDVGTSKAEYIIQQLNVSNAKKVALLLALSFIVFHGFIHFLYGSDSCKWLLSDGRFKGDKEWQPYGCMMHKYTQTDIRRCYQSVVFYGKQNYIIFIGDNRLRMLYQSFVKTLQTYGNDLPAEDNTSILYPNDDDMDDKKHLEFIDYKLRLRVNYIKVDEITKSMLDEFSKLESAEPSAIILSCTYRQLKSGNLTDDILKHYSANLTQLLRPINNLIEKKTKVLWKLQDPIDEENISNNWKNVTNNDIDRFNYAAINVLKSTSHLHIWTSSKLIAGGLMNEMKQGWILSRLALQHNVQILLNMYCNDYMNFNDGSCCSSAESYTILQIVTYSVFAVALILSIAMVLRKWILMLRGQTFYVPLDQNALYNAQDESVIIMNCNQSNTTFESLASNELNSPSNAATSTASLLLSDISKPIFAIATLAMIMAYFYLCDRTNFFMKENKYYSEFSFWIPIGYVFVLGLFFTDDSRYTKIIHRDQTDELRGWMQIVILIYHLTGADRILPIYMYIKVLISGYLFLSGYGHFTYMWHTGNAGITRFLQIMFRLNFMTIILCLCMNRPYQFYYFVPLLSFWYVIIYCVLALPPQITSFTIDLNPYHYLYLVLKFIGLLSCITIFYMSEVFFERIFVTRPWKALFVTTDDDIHEWWYRWKLDRYTMTYGMIFGTMYLVAQKYSIIDDNNHSNLFSRRVSLTATLAAFIGIGFYTTFSFLCRNRLDCEEIHSYIVFIPIISYMVLRNISGILRTRFSSFFAWFGRISLELFICQYHIWLAADRHGVLVLLPGFPNLNVLLTLFIFVCASHEVHKLTLILLPYAVPNDWKLAIRNFIIFLIILIPIARYDGMF